MAKIKLSLPTGVVEEKILLNAFKADNNSYIIFDAENVGSMGLPIILVCKYDNDRVTKITDSDEWTKVKGYLKEIISGVSKEYINLPESLNVDEVYYTQLTLPVASFDVLKASYVPELKEDSSVVSAVSENSNIVNLETQVNEVSNENLEVSKNLQPDMPLDSDVTAIANPILGDNIALGQSEVENDSLNAGNIGSEADNNQVVTSENNIVSSSEPFVMGTLSPDLESSNLGSELNTINNPVISSEGTVDLDVKEINQQPAISDVVTTTEYVSNADNQSSTSNDYSVDKEAFLAACANMFDALVSKFEAKNKGNNN